MWVGVSRSCNKVSRGTNYNSVHVEGETLTPITLQPPQAMCLECGELIAFKYIDISRIVSN